MKKTFAFLFTMSFLTHSVSGQTLQFLKKITSGSGSYTQCNNLGIDVSSNLYAVGTFINTTDFGGTSLTAANGQNLYIAKYNSVATLQWVRQITGNLNVGYDAVTDASGNTYLTAGFSSTINVGGTTLTPTFGNNFFVAKYNSSGMLLWVTQIGNNSSGSSTLSSKIACDASGNVYLTGNYVKSANFGGVYIFSNSNYNNVFVAKFNTSGVVQWVHTGGGSLNNTATATSLCVDANGNVFVYGKCNGTFTLFGTNYSEIRQAFFIAKFTSLGGLINLYTAIALANVNTLSVNDIQADNSGNIIISGEISGGNFNNSQVDFGGVILAAGLFIVKFNNGLGVVWSKSEAVNTQFLFSNPYPSTRLTTDGSGNIYLTGYFYGTPSNFSGTNLTTFYQNGYDLFLAKYSSTGTFQFVKQVSLKAPTAGKVMGMGVAVFGSNNIFLSGFFGWGTADFFGTNLTSGGYQDSFILGLQQSNCPSSLSPTGTISTNQKAATSVISTGINIIPNAANVTYQAGSFVQLNAGFSAVSGSVFTAKILGGCM